MDWKGLSEHIGKIRNSFEIATTENFEVFTNPWPKRQKREHVLEQLYSQGWWIGPKIVKQEEATYLGYDEYCCGLLIDDDEPPVWDWKFTLFITAHFNMFEGRLDEHLHVTNYGGLSDILNITLDPDYIYHSTHALLSNRFASEVGKTGGVYPRDFSQRIEIAVTIPLTVVASNILSKQPTWLLDSEGNVHYGCPGPKDKLVGAKGRTIRKHLSRCELVPLKDLKNLKAPPLVQYVLRYCMIQLECDSPILEALFENWTGKSDNAPYSPSPEGRLFPRSTGPTHIFYEKRNDVWESRPATKQDRV